MRKLLTTLVALALLTALAACGTSGGDDDAGGKDATTTTASGDDETTTTEEETTTTEASDDAVAVDEWVDGFCGSFSSWLTGIQDASDQVGSQVTEGDLASAQTALSDLFGTASDLTGDLIDEVEGLGTPDIDDGDQLVTDLTDRFQQFADAADTAQADVDALELDPATFQDDAQALTETFQTEAGAVADSFAEIDEDYPSPELASALSSCDF